MVEKNWIKELDKAKAKRVEPAFKDVEVNFTINFTIPTSQLKQENNTKDLVEIANKLLSLSTEERHKAVWQDGTPIFERIEIDSRATLYKYS
jgi:hypothetical protein